MKRVFPPMNDRPEAFMPFATLAYWIFAFVLIPLFLPMIGDGLWGDHKFSSWLDFVYHAINALAVGLMLKTYFVDSFLNVQLDTGKFFNTVGVALSLMLPLAGALYFFRVPVVMDAYPINEMGVAVSSGVMVEQLPVFGTLCHVLFTPITVVGLFYTVAFAPACCHKPWLGYLAVTALLMLPPAFDILWRGETEYVVNLVLLQLPVHLIACWSYQKADTVWAPLATLSVFNLVTSLINLYCLR